MKIPALYYALGAAVLVTVGSLVAAWTSYKHELQQRAASEALNKRDMALIASWAKRVKTSDSATLHNIGATRAAITVYDTVRLRVTSKPVTDTVIIVAKGDTVQVVPAGYVRVTDAAIKQCKLLEASCGEFRLYADSTMAAQTRIIEQLRIVGKRSGSRLGLGAFAGVCTDKKPCAGVGATLKVF